MGALAKMFPAPIVKRLRAVIRWWDGQPPIGGINFGDLRQLRPVSRAFGSDRGLAVDRYYVERFLESRRPDIRGRVMEVGESTYTRRFGGEKVSRSDVLHVHDRNPTATIVGDLAHCPHVPDESFDCIILTQTLQLIFDLPAAMRSLNRILAPNGVLLVTVPGMSQVADSEWRKTWYWSFTTLAVERLLSEGLPGADIDVRASGNVLAATAFLQGISASELSQKELDIADPDYQLLITARAVKVRSGL